MRKDGSDFIRKQVSDMQEQSFRSGLCPKCDKVLQIPAELTEFSCMYCGARLYADDLSADKKEIVSADFDEACGKLVRCVTEYPGFNRRITRSDYVPAFEDYREGCEPIFRELDAAVRMGGDREAQCETAAVRFLDDLEAVWKQSARWKNRSSQNGLIDDDKLVIAIFMVPLVRHLKLSVSEPFAEALQRNWVQRHPKTPFYIGDYDSIANGFRKKRFGLCFITTAVCEAEGLGDDCAQLHDFRSFRDGYLRTCPDGAELINEYYDIAPGIVTCIDHCADREARYAAIRETYLDPCWQDLKQGRMEECKARYVQMVRDLQKQYLS